MPCACVVRVWPGGFPEDMLKRGRDVAKYLTPDRVIYEYNKEDNSV